MWMCNVSGMMLMYIRCVGALVWMVQWWEEVWFELKPKFGHGLPPIWTHQIRYQPIPSFHKYSLTILSHADGFTVLFCCSNILFHPKISGANVCVFRTTGMFIKCTNPNNHPNSLTVSSNVEKLNNCTMLVIYRVSWKNLVEEREELTGPFMKFVLPTLITQSAAKSHEKTYHNLRVTTNPPEVPIVVHTSTVH